MGVVERMYTDGILYIWAGKHYRALFWEMRKKKSDRERTKKKKKKKNLVLNKHNGDKP